MNEAGNAVETDVDVAAFALDVLSDTHDGSN